MSSSYLPLFWHIFKFRQKNKSGRSVSCAAVLASVTHAAAFKRHRYGTAADSSHHAKQQSAQQVGGPVSHFSFIILTDRSWAGRTSLLCFTNPFHHRLSSSLPPRTITQLYLLSKSFLFCLFCSFSSFSSILLRATRFSFSAHVNDSLLYCMHLSYAFNFFFTKTILLYHIVLYCACLCCSAYVVNKLHQSHLYSFMFYSPYCYGQPSFLPYCSQLV